MMGMLVDGQWQETDGWAGKDGSFKRQTQKFRDWITADGDSGPDGQNAVKAETGRFYLYISYACPWAHRALIMRSLKGLDKHIGLSVVHPHMLDQGWSFETGFSGASGDELYGFSHLKDLYVKADPEFTGRVTVPVLWDKKEERIINNESADILRILNTAFNEITGNDEDYYPPDLREEIDAVNERVYHEINNGVYKVGFATKQEVYDREIVKLFHGLDWLEHRLSDGRQYLVGDRLTEADIRLFTTIVRFDAVYFIHFKCSQAAISDYSFLQDYLECLYRVNAIKETVRMDHIKAHYYYSHKHLNPYRIVPHGPDLAWLSKEHASQAA